MQTFQNFRLTGRYWVNYDVEGARGTVTRSAGPWSPGPELDRQRRDITAFAHVRNVLLVPEAVPDQRLGGRV